VLKKHLLLFIAILILINVSIKIIFCYTTDQMFYTRIVFDVIIFDILFGFILYNLKYTFRYINFKKLELWQIVSYQLLILLAILSLFNYAINELLNIDLIADRKKEYMIIDFQFIRALLISYTYIIYALLNYMILFQKENSGEEGELRTLLKDSELKAIKYRLNPHFIFNSLNSVNALCYTKPEEAAEMSFKLAEFLRTVFKEGESQIQQLEEEIKAFQEYIDIERVRFKDKVQIVYDIDENCLNYQVPTLVLQPLIENAVKYGVQEHSDKTIIILKVTSDKKKLNIELSNPITEENKIIKSNGLGLKITKERLRLLYQDNATMQIQKSTEEFVVKLSIPHSSSSY
jgi:two-component system, LytTR family, sensor kinase